MGYRVKPFTMRVRNNSTQEFEEVGLLGHDVDGDIAELQSKTTALTTALTTVTNNLTAKTNSLASSLRDRKFVLIGDSYGMRNTPNWVSLFQQVFGSSVIAADARGSHGFASGSLTFLSILTDVANNLSDDQKTSVTDIIVCGGWNDARWLKQGGTASGLQTAIFTFCNYALQNFPNAIVTLEYVGWQLGPGASIQDNLTRSNLLTARKIYDATWRKNLRHGCSMLKVTLNPTVHDSSGFHPDASVGAENLFYALLNDITGDGQMYYLTGTMGNGDITMGSGIGGSATTKRWTQMDGMCRLELTFQNVTGLGNNKTLCTFNLFALPVSLWGSLAFFANVQNGTPIYCILDTSGALKVYGASSSFTSSMNIVIRETIPMIISE